MSWAAHDVEPYLIKKHLAPLERRLGFEISFLAILIGSWGPDLLTKWIIHGINIGGYEIRADNPAQFHRGWPGVGFTHSLAFGVAVGVLVYFLGGRRGWARTWAVGLMLGTWAHVFSDTLDTNGVMLWFPLSLDTVSLEVWAYAGQTTRNGDGAAYFSSLGFVWDGFWILLVLANYQTLRLDYFRAHIVSDPVFRFLGQRMHWPEEVLVILYRGAFFYGVSRWVAWFIWAHVLNTNEFDLSLGGPYWVTPFEMIMPLVGLGP